MNKKFRSSCIIASCLDMIGDKWSLLIIRDMLMHRKKTFKELSDSAERPATNLLSSRLKLLERLEIISKRKLPINKKENIYLLTEKGIELAPIIIEIVIWSDNYIREYHPEMSINKFRKMDKHKVISRFQNDYRKFALQYEAKMRLDQN